MFVGMAKLLKVEGGITFLPYQSMIKYLNDAQHDNTTAINSTDKHIKEIRNFLLTSCYYLLNLYKS